MLEMGAARLSKTPPSSLRLPAVPLRHNSPASLRHDSTGHDLAGRDLADQELADRDLGLKLAPRPGRRPARVFLLTFLLLLLGGLGGLATGHVVLGRLHLLPAPPLAATWCIDEKFAALRDAPLDDRTLLAVGSSATWRNLDMALLEQRLPGTRAYNGAPCYLHVDQTAYLTEFLLQRMPDVKTVLTVLAPRDFEACPDEATAFFDERLGAAYVDGQVPRWLPYLTGFRPLYLAREVVDLRRGRPLGPEDVASDGLGSEILRAPQEWRPPPEFDEACYDGLARLEATAAARGARLVVATLPVMPEWGAAFDPGGAQVEAWTRRMAATLQQPGTLLIDGRRLGWGDTAFADPVHLLYPHHRAFTDFVARAVARTAPRATPAGS